MKLLAVALAVVAVGVTAGLQAPVQQSPDKMMGEELYAAYLASGPSILTKAFPTNQRYEDFRKNFHDPVFERWGKTPRVFSRAMFMFDVSLAAHPHGFPYWADFLQLGQTYLRKLRQPIGVDGAQTRFLGRKLHLPANVAERAFERQVSREIREAIGAGNERLNRHPTAPVDAGKGFVEAGVSIEARRCDIEPARRADKSI